MHLNHEFLSLNLICLQMWSSYHLSLSPWRVQKQLVAFASFSFWIHFLPGSAPDVCFEGEEVGEAEEVGQSEFEVSWLCPPLILHASLKLKYVVATS